MITTTPQEELKAVKARARKAAEKARAQLAKAKQETIVFARDADRARQELLKAREEVKNYSEYSIRLLDLYEKEVKFSNENLKRWMDVCREADNLKIENARLRRQLEEAQRSEIHNFDSSKIWEFCPN